MTHLVPVPTARPRRGRLPIYIRLWFILDLGLALFPPLHWWASVPEPVLGLPRALVYLAASSLIITASIVVAYLQDSVREPA